MKNSEPNWIDQAESILDQLLKFTAQLSELENDPQVDPKALSDACIRRLDDLKQLIPENLNSPPAQESGVIEKMRDLYGRTQTCLEILERKKNRTAARIQSLTRTSQAVRAYGTRRGGGQGG